jgi:P4 family phage/plasmid primase-like protien
MSGIADNPRIAEQELAAISAAKERLPKSLASYPGLDANDQPAAIQEIMADLVTITLADSLQGGTWLLRVVETTELDKRELRKAVKERVADYRGLAAKVQEPKPTRVRRKAKGTPNSHGQNGRALDTPSQWFAQKFPALADQFGDAVLEETDKAGVVSARDIGEDFLAATLGSEGCPDSPTVFAQTEEKFWTYSPSEGIFIFEREPALQTRLSSMLLECARACRGDGCETKTLEFRFRDSANLTGVLKKARGLLAVPHDFFSTNLSEFIPCANGMLRLQDRTLLPFSPSYRRRNKLAVPFDAIAKCPLFLDTLMRPALDPDELDLLQRWCGLALIGENLAQRLLILDGTAGGGKGTFIRVLSGIIGQVNLASLRTQLLGERFELGRFIGKTLLYGADVPSDFLNQKGASVLKSLTGGDPVTLEFKNSNESPSITCKFNVIVTCNSRLTVRLEGDTEAWRRRLAVIEYRKPKPDKVIADLDQRILANEGSGVLNWMLEGLDKLRADGWQLNLNARQQAIVDNLLLESDGHAVFARECLRPDATQNLTVPDCFAAYVEFCTQRGWTALTKNKFGTLIGDVIVRQFGITPRHDIRDADNKAQRGWRGITLSSNSTEPTGGMASEVSATRPSDESDTSWPVQPVKSLPDLLPDDATVQAWQDDCKSKGGGA